MTTKLHLSDNPELLAAALAEFILNDIGEVLKTSDRYSLVLSGGSTPKLLYRVLSEEPYKSKIPWEKVHFFWGDERFVPFDDHRNNAKMATDELLARVPADPKNIHTMKTDLTPEESAAQYTRVLNSYFPQSGRTFDLVLLGMGDDGHTLSLFPGTQVVHENEKWVDAFYLEPQSMFRITLTAPVVNRAGKIVFLATGKNKAGVLNQVLYGKNNPDLYPSQVIQPEEGELHWFIDEAAAEELP